MARVKYLLAQIANQCCAFLTAGLRTGSSSQLMQHIGRGMFWSLFGAIASRAGSLGASVVISRHLGIEAFGQFGAIQATVAMLATFGGLGLSITVTKHVSQYFPVDRNKVGRILGMSLVGSIMGGGLVAAGLFAGVDLIGYHLLGQHDLATPLRVTAILPILGALNGVQTGALIGLQSFRAIAKINVLLGALTLTLLSGGTYFGGLEGCCIALVLVQVTICVVTDQALRRDLARKQMSISYRGAWKERSIFYSFALPALAGGLLVEPINWLCTIMVIRQPGGYADIGVYYAATQWGTALLFVPNLLGQVVFPLLSEAFSQNNTNKFVRLFVLSVGLNATIVACVLVVLGWIAPQLLELYGADWARHSRIFIVVIATASLLSVVAPAGYVVAVTGRMWVGFSMNLAWALCFIVLTRLLLGHGVLGLAVARATSYILHAIWTAIFVLNAISHSRKERSEDPSPNRFR